MNPSTEDILAAIQSVPAKTVFVLPNNKNIIMAAEQARSWPTVRWWFCPPAPCPWASPPC